MMPTFTEGWKRMPALVGAERGIELHAEAAVDPHLAAVVDPRHAEDDLPLGLADPLDQRVVGIVGMLGDDPAEALEHLADRLMEFRLAGVAAHDLGEDGLELFVDADQSVPQVRNERRDAIPRQRGRGNLGSGPLLHLCDRRRVHTDARCEHPPQATEIKVDLDRR